MHTLQCDKTGHKTRCKLLRVSTPTCHFQGVRFLENVFGLGFQVVISYILGANSYVFRHQGAIFREFVSWKMSFGQYSMCCRKQHFSCKPLPVSTPGAIFRKFLSRKMSLGQYSRCCHKLHFRCKLLRVSTPRCHLQGVCFLENILVLSAQFREHSSSNYGLCVKRCKKKIGGYDRNDYGELSY